MEQEKAITPYKALIPGVGRSRYACEVIGEIGEKFRIRLLEDYRGPGRGRQGAKGDTILVPKSSIRLPKVTIS